MDFYTIELRIVTLGLAITLGMLVLIVIQSTNHMTAQGGNGNVNATEARFLFIQGAQSGSISQVNATTSTLQLSDVSDKTIMFSDRPDRIVGSANTADFISNWSIGEINFAVDPPNAVLILDDEVEQRQDFAIIELFNPEYDPEEKTLRYDITAENATMTTTTSSVGLPTEFGQSTLVIDDKVLGDAPAMPMGDLYQRYAH